MNKYAKTLRIIFILLMILDLVTAIPWILAIFIMITIVPLALTIWLFVLHLLSFLSLSKNGIISHGLIVQQVISGVLLGGIVAFISGFFFDAFNLGYQGVFMYSGVIFAFGICMSPLVLIIWLNNKAKSTSSFIQTDKSTPLYPTIQTNNTQEK